MIHRGMDLRLHCRVGALNKQLPRMAVHKFCLLESLLNARTLRVCPDGEVTMGNLSISDAKSGFHLSESSVANGHNFGFVAES